MVLNSALEARRTLDEDLALTLAAAEWEWAGMTSNVEKSWQQVGPRLTGVVETGQMRAATNGADAVAPILAEQGSQAQTSSVAFNPRSLVGVASDGRELVSLLTIGAVRVVQAMEAGVVAAQALGVGWEFIQTAVSTQIADAARVALQTQSLVSSKRALMVRVVNPGACSRCIALAGFTTGDLEAFERHPRCRCVNVPFDSDIPGEVGTEPSSYFDSMSEEEQNNTFTKAGAQAIRDGADIHQVVNARRGMSSTVDSAGRNRLSRDEFGNYTTTEGMSRRGHARRVMAQNPNWSREFRGQKVVTTSRLMPESIYGLAKDRDDAIRLLKLYGYF